MKAYASLINQQTRNLSSKLSFNSDEHKNVSQFAYIHNYLGEFQHLRFNLK